MDKTLEKIKSFAKEAHGKQKRKYTGEPYIVHPVRVRVMEICKHYTDKLPVLASALLHDVLEDTHVSAEDLKKFLNEVMNPEEAYKTLKLVLDLTDVYIKEDYPDLNRKKRKNKEAERLQKADPDAHTVKYADTIDNAMDITRHDKDFASTFLSEAQFLLNKMDKGIPELYEKTKETITDCFKELKRQKKKSGYNPGKTDF